MYPTLCKSNLHKDTKYNLKFYILKIAMKMATCPMGGARRPSGWEKMPFQNSLNTYKYVSKCEWYVVGGMCLCGWVGMLRVVYPLVYL